MKLVISKGTGKDKEFSVEEGENLIGRWDPDGGAFPEIDLEGDDPDAKVSRKHAIIHRKGDFVSIEDIGSRNGTFINRGTRLAHGARHELKDGDEIIVGKTMLRFHQN